MKDYRRKFFMSSLRMESNVSTLVFSSPDWTYSIPNARIVERICEGRSQMSLNSSSFCWYFFRWYSLFEGLKAFEYQHFEVHIHYCLPFKYNAMYFSAESFELKWGYLGLKEINSLSASTIVADTACSKYPGSGSLSNGTNTFEGGTFIGKVRFTYLIGSLYASVNE